MRELWLLCYSFDGWLTLGSQPGAWQQLRQFVCGRIAHQFVEDPLEVGERVLAVAADLLDEGVDHGAAPAGGLAANEHPVLRAQFQRTDRVFGAVVVDVDLAVGKAGLKVRPLAAGIAQRLTERAAGRDGAHLAEVNDELAEASVVFPGFKPACPLSVERAGPLVAQAGFDLIDPRDPMEDACGDARVVVAGSMKLAADVGEAGYGCDVEPGMALDEGGVCAQAVALKVAVEGWLALRADEDVVQAGVGAAFVPIEEHAVFGMAVGPEVSERGFALAGLKAFDRSFIDLDVAGCAHACGDGLMERQQAFGEVVVPGAHEVAREFDAVGGAQFPFLAVKGAVVAELLGEKVGSERRGEHAAGQQAGF